MQRKQPSTLIITEDVAIAHTSTRSAPRIAKVLGREIRSGVEVVWLDRLIQQPCEEFDGWSVAGAISSVCQRTVPSHDR
jgi:hypothetical protein